MKLKKLFLLLSSSVLMPSFLISCSNKEKEDKQQDEQGINQIVTTQIERAVDSSLKSIKVEDIFINPSDGNEEDEIEEGEYSEEEDSEEDEENEEELEESEEESSSTKRLLEELLKKKQKHLRKINTYKKVGITAGVTSAVIVGLSAGLGAYFGNKYSDEQAIADTKTLEEHLKLYKNIYKEANPSDPLVNVLEKVVEVAFTKELPTAIFDVLKQTVLKDVLSKFNADDSEKKLIEKIKSSKETTKEVVRELLTSLTKLELNKTKDNEEAAKKVKGAIIKIIKLYLPTLIKGVLDFLAVKSNDTNGTSIIADILVNTLSKFNIKVEKTSELSDILQTYIKLLAKKENNLINYVIRIASEALGKVDLSFNIIGDVFRNINTFIDIILARDENGKKKVDVNKVVKVLLPELVRAIEISPDQDYSSFVKFVNSMFEKNNGTSQGTNNNSNNKWVYELISSGKFKPEQNKNVTLENQVTSSSSSQGKVDNKETKNDTNSIIIPELDINLDEKFGVLLELENISGVITKLFNLLFEPLVLQLKDKQKDEKQNKDASSNNSTNKDDVKKAITRLTGLISYIYYKLKPIKGESFFKKLTRDITPSDPKYAIPKTISKLFKKHNITDIQLTDLFGESISDKYLFIFTTSSYRIFSEAKKQSENSSESSNKLKTIFEKGCAKDLDKTDSSKK